MARRLAENITSDHLTCPICRDTLKAPRMLPCEHTMCSECLVQLIRSSRHLNSFLCPVDRGKIVAPSYTATAEEWVKSLPVDELASTLLETVSGKETQSTLIRKGTPCSEHHEKICEFFCFNCCEIMCCECAVNRHKSDACDCVVFSKCEERVNVKLDGLAKDMNTLIGFGENTMSRDSGDDMRMIQCKSKVRDTVMKLVRIVQDFERQTYIKLSTILESLNKVANTEDLDRAVSAINGDLRLKIGEVENVMNTGNTEDKLATLAGLQTFIQQNTDQLYNISEASNPIELKLELNQKFLELCKKMSVDDLSVGNLHAVPVESVDFEDTETRVGNYQLKFSSNTSDIISVEFPVLSTMKGGSDIKGNLPRYTDMIFCGHSIIVVDSENSKIQRFLCSDEIKFVDETFINGVYGVVHVHGSDDVIVTAPYGQPKLVRLSTYSGLLKVMESATDAPYFEITLLPDEKYAAIRHEAPITNLNKRICFEWSRGTSSHIDIIDQNGGVLQHFNESLLCEPDEFGEPFIMPLKCLCGLPNGDLVVTIETKTNDFITCIDQSGKISWTYDLHDKPEGVCCSDDRIFVYLRESKIVRVLSFNGDLMPRSTYRFAEYDGDGTRISLNHDRNLIGVIDKTEVFRLYKLIQ